jgi:selenide,water dikinase
MEQVRLTQFSPGAGCGCKISSTDLEKIIKPNLSIRNYSKLLVGYETKDDAAVYDLGDGKAIISTTDFFTPIVDSPFDFGRIAAVNAISDVYAMGGKPIMAVSILGWPLEKLSDEMASQVIDGARKACEDAECALAGGHSINISDPIFGLAVTGTIDISNIKKNNKAEEGCILFLTKPLGIGLITTAEKKGIVKQGHKEIALKLMTTLNKAGIEFGKLSQVKAMTDVTGFGFLGHLLEICEGSRMAAKINYNKIPVIKGIEDYITQKAIPGGTFRNWKSYGHKIDLTDEIKKMILCDPQTSGGLLVAVSPDGLDEFLKVSFNCGLKLEEIGKIEKCKPEKPFITFSD